jgi:hypothetical protein
MTPLCKLAYKYKTDKCPRLGHTYTPFYHEIFKEKRKKVKKVLEIGIGYPKIMKHVPGYITGASLYMWRDYFPKAQIFGADINPETMLKAERIKTFLCDSMNKKDLQKLIGQTGSDIDIFIDDGPHSPHNQAFLCQTVLPLLSKKTIYIIEDVKFPRKLKSLLPEYQLIILDFNLNREDGHQSVWDKLVIVGRKEPTTAG